MAAPRVVLSIAGYDPSSGAGITADIKTAEALGCYAITAITALTVQSTLGVFAVEPVDPELLRQTLERLRQDFDISAVRIGMLGSAAVAKVVAGFLEREGLPNVVLDPVIRSSSGAALIEPAGLEVLRLRLLSLVDLITPNLDEAMELTADFYPTQNSSDGTDQDPHPGRPRLDGAPEDSYTSNPNFHRKSDRAPGGLTWETAEPRIRQMADRLHAMGARGVVITGGHLSQPNDFLSLKQGGETIREVFPGDKLDSRSTHGTGCAFAMAIACLLTRPPSFPEATAGQVMSWAVGEAKSFVRGAIEAGYSLGKGTGPMNHLYRFTGISRK